MMLEALYGLAERDGLMSDPDYEFKPVAWLIRVDRGGKLLGIEGTHHLSEGKGRQKPRPTAKVFPVPRDRGRTSGDRAFFLCDKAEYALGLEPVSADGKRRTKSKLTARSALFREQVRQCLDATGDDGVRAALTFLEAVAAGNVQVTLPAECAPNDLFAFVYAPDKDLLVHERPTIRAYWKGRREERDGEGVPERRCLVTGNPIVTLGNFPLVKRVPGGTSSGVALVSFNSRAFESHGWDGNENAAISRDAAEGCATALSRLVHPAFPDPRPAHRGQTLPRRNFVISDDTVVCFWASDRHADAFLDQLPFLMLGDDPGKVSDVYRSLWKGMPVELDDPSVFYALTLSGTQGRAIIRDWFESSVRRVAADVARHFRDLAIVRNTPPPKGKELAPVITLRALLGSLAPFGKSDQIPDMLATQFVHAALRGTPYPFSILQRALERTRAEIGRSDWPDLERRDARAALLKAVLNRRHRDAHASAAFQEITPMLDPQNTSPGYLLGRLMAVLERLQQVALKDLNASVIDRYFGSASATPKAVFTRLLKNARHHARKAFDDERTAGTARWLDKLIDEITASFDPGRNGFPAYLTLEEQGLFVLGYHQQRHWLWLSKEKRDGRAA